MALTIVNNRADSLGDANEERASVARVDDLTRRIKFFLSFRGRVMVDRST